MTKHLVAGALLALGLPALGSAACTGTTTPANLLNGQRWAFDLANPIDGAYAGGQRAIAGVFTGYTGGWVNFYETLNLNGTVYRDANTWGQWTSNATCDAGTLKFSLFYIVYTFNFTITGPGIMRISLADERSYFSMVPGPITQQKALRGIGKLLTGPAGCPARFASMPLNLLNGMKYDYTLEGTGFKETGRASASLWAPGAYSGLLSLNRKIEAVPSTALIANIVGGAGRYIVYSDCLGGELLMNTNGFVRQVEFFFSKSDFSEMFLIEDGQGTPIAAGIATKVP